MQIISIIALHNYKVPVIIKKFTFCLRKSRENLINIFQDFPGLTNKSQGLSRTAKKIQDFPGLFQDVATLQYDPETIRQSMHWKITNSPQFKKAK